MSVEISRSKVKVSDIPDLVFAEIGESESHNHNGEAPDHFSQRTLRLAHKAVEMFPDFKRRHRKFIGTVEVVGTAAIVVVSALVAKRLLAAGMEASDREVLEGLREDDLTNIPSKPDKPGINGNNPRRH